MEVPELTALLGASAGLLGIIYKMWADHTKLAMKVTDAFEANACASTKLQAAVDANTKSTDHFSKLLIDMVKKTK